MPTGKNKIPKMSYLAEVLSCAGFPNVRTYIQSGNIVLDTDMEDTVLSSTIRTIIQEKIGADLSAIVKNNTELETAIHENPFGSDYDYSRIHLVFTNDAIDSEKLGGVLNTNFGEELFCAGSECLYMYLPRTAKKKRLNTIYLEKRLMITATMRKSNVISHLHDM